MPTTTTVQPRKVRTGFVALRVTVRFFFRTDFQVELSSVPVIRFSPNFFSDLPKDSTCQIRCYCLLASHGKGHYRRHSVWFYVVPLYKPLYLVRPSFTYILYCTISSAHNRVWWAEERVQYCLSDSLWPLSLFSPPDRIVGWRELQSSQGNADYNMTKWAAICWTLDFRS